MPKTLAEFEGEIANKRTISGWCDGPVRWRVEATPTVIGPRIKVRSNMPNRQEFPDGVVRVSQLAAQAHIRPALVRVEVVSDGPLASWLRPGLHLGAVVESAEFTLGEPA